MDLPWPPTCLSEADEHHARAMATGDPLEYLRNLMHPRPPGTIDAPQPTTSSNQADDPLARAQPTAPALARPGTTLGADNELVSRACFTETSRRPHEFHSSRNVPQQGSYGRRRAATPPPPPLGMRSRPIRYQRPRPNGRPVTPPLGPWDTRQQQHYGRVVRRQLTSYASFRRVPVSQAQQQLLDEERKEHAEWLARWVELGRAQRSENATPPAPARSVSLAEKYGAQVEWSKRWTQQPYGGVAVNGDEDEGDAEDGDMDVDMDEGDTDDVDRDIDMDEADDELTMATQMLALSDPHP